MSTRSIRLLVASTTTAAIMASLPSPASSAPEDPFGRSPSRAVSRAADPAPLVRVPTYAQRRADFERDRAAWCYRPAEFLFWAEELDADIACIYPAVLPGRCAQTRK